MSDFVTRPATAADAPEMAGFFNDIALAAGGDPWFMVDTVAGWVGSGLVRDPHIDTRIVLADGVPIAVGLVSPPSGADGKVDAWGGVRPQWRGRGIGRSLLAWQWDRAVAMCPPGASWEFDADCYLAETATIRLFERFGLSVVRYWFEMGMPLDGLVTTPVPAGVTVRAYAEAMARELHTVTDDVFRDAFGYDPRPFDQWAELGVRTDSFRGDLSRVAVDRDRAIVGFVLVSDQEDERLSVDWVGVRRSWRGRGLASALLSAALLAGADDGRAYATINADASNPTGALVVYERIGFNVLGATVSFRKAIESATR